MAKFKVLFVCSGNTCRSPMAEQIFRHFLKKKRAVSKFDVKSAGLYAQIGDSIMLETKTALAHLGIEPKEQTAVQLSSKLAGSSDMIVCMTEGHKAAIFGAKNCYSFAEIAGEDVPDPYMQGIEEYEKTANYILNSCDKIHQLAKNIIKNTTKANKRS